MAMELISVIKNDGPGGLLFWKHEKEDFRTGSQLIVAENEEALFVKDGVIVQTFSGGKFTLSTANYPFIDRIRAAFTGGVSAFHCKVFFVNKADALDLKWGTDSPIQIRDPKYEIVTHLQGRGSYTVRVQDAKKFVLKFVANNIQGVDSSAVSSMFRDAFLQKIKSCIARGIRESGQEVLGIVEDLDTLAGRLSPLLTPVMEEYGLELVNFYLSALDIPMDDPSRAKLESLFATKAEFNVLGDNWQRVQGRDILMGMATNQGAAGAAAGAGAGLGMGMAAGGVMGAMAGATFAPFAQPAAPAPAAPAPAAPSRFAPRTPTANPAGETGTVCPNCGKPVPASSKFCGECGTKIEVKKAFCVNCGHELAPGQKFCGECGTKQP